MAAFGEKVRQVHRDLVTIGKNIVERCANNPLAIKVVGSLLYGRGKDKWSSVLENMRLGRTNKSIHPIFKLSYHNLETPLKTCFSYCAIFPKDHRIEKEMLIRLWIAQGFVIPLDEGQSIEDASEEYFSILLKRCFFQDVTRDENGEIVAFKIHDLLHDIAEEVIGKEILNDHSIQRNLVDKVRHVFFYSSWGENITNQLLTCTKIRTCICAWPHLGLPLPFDTIRANWKCLRALSLNFLSVTKLPSALGEQQHLRYLDLSENRKIQVLPNSIAKLYNLEFLILRQCNKLQELPKNLSKLTKLRVLDTTECDSLTHMPSHMGKLHCLWKLPYFVVGAGNSSKKGSLLACQVEEIKALHNLKGSFHIHINIPTDAKDVIENGRKGGCLSQRLTDIVITFSYMGDSDDIRTRLYEHGETLLEDLQPHGNLRELKLVRYYGRRMPNWATEDNLAIFLPNLVSIFLERCKKLRHIAVFANLPKLKSLVLSYLDDLEYIENARISSRSTSSGRVGALRSQQPFFPSLEKLHLSNLPKLIGWWRDDSNQIDGGLVPSFPCLSKLHVTECHNLESMPLCPTAKDLWLWNCNRNLRIMGSIESGNSKLISMRIDNMRYLKSAMPMEAFQCLQSMVIQISLLENAMRNILQWNNLSRGGSMHHIALEDLALNHVPSMSLSNNIVEGNGMEDEIPWKYVARSLRSLDLIHLPEVVKLPNGMRYLTALESLKIEWCTKLEAMPEWMPELTSLKQLHIEGCSDTLHNRCRKDTGQDWRKIQHIPIVKIGKTMFATIVALCEEQFQDISD